MKTKQTEVKRRMSITGAVASFATPRATVAVGGEASGECGVRETGSSVGVGRVRAVARVEEGRRRRVGRRGRSEHASLARRRSDDAGGGRRRSHALDCGPVAARSVDGRRAAVEGGRSSEWRLRVRTRTEPEPERVERLRRRS